MVYAVNDTAVVGIQEYVDLTTLFRGDFASVDRVGQVVRTAEDDDGNRFFRERLLDYGLTACSFAYLSCYRARIKRATAEAGLPFHSPGINALAAALCFGSHECEPVPCRMHPDVRPPPAHRPEFPAAGPKVRPRMPQLG
jgi:hypothetical protein